MANAIVNTQAWKRRALDLKAAVFNAGLIVLNTRSGFTPAYGSVLTDITEPADSGYEAQTPVYGAAADYGVGDARITADLLTWGFTLSAGPFTIYSACQLDAAGVLLWAYEFDSPVVISAAGPWGLGLAYGDGDF